MQRAFIGLLRFALTVDRTASRPSLIVDIAQRLIARAARRRITIRSARRLIIRHTPPLHAGGAERSRCLKPIRARVLTTAIRLDEPLASANALALTIIAVRRRTCRTCRDTSASRTVRKLPGGTGAGTLLPIPRCVRAALAEATTPRPVRCVTRRTRTRAPGAGQKLARGANVLTSSPLINLAARASVIALCRPAEIKLPIRAPLDTRAVNAFVPHITTTIRRRTPGKIRCIKRTKIGVPMRKRPGAITVRPTIRSPRRIAPTIAGSAALAAVLARTVMTRVRNRNSRALCGTTTGETARSRSRCRRGAPRPCRSASARGIADRHTVGIRPAVLLGALRPLTERATTTTTYASVPVLSGVITDGRGIRQNAVRPGIRIRARSTTKTNINLRTGTMRKCCLATVIADRIAVRDQPDHAAVIRIARVVMRLPRLTAARRQPRLNVRIIAVRHPAGSAPRNASGIRELIAIAKRER